MDFYNTDSRYLEKLNRKHKFEYRALLQVVNTLENKDASILEVGCGVGNFLYVLNSEGYKNVEGVDTCERFVRHAKSLVGDCVKNIDIIKYDTKKKYDCVILADVLEHSTNPDGIFRKIRSLLKPNGVVILHGPNLLQVIGGKSFIGLTGLFLFFKKAINFYIFKRIHLKFIVPRLDNKTHKIDDADACYLLNPFDVFYLGRKNKIKMHYISTFYNPKGNYGTFKRVVIGILSVIPFIGLMGGSIFYVGVANPNNYYRDFAKKLKKTMKRVH